MKEGTKRISPKPTERSIKKRTLTKSDILRKNYPSRGGTSKAVKKLGRLGWG